VVIWVFVQPASPEHNIYRADRRVIQGIFTQ